MLNPDPVTRQAELDEFEMVFHSPPFTDEIVSAISLIAPQFKFAADEESRRYWEKDQNGSCWGEYEALSPLLAKLSMAKNILEIGPGIGRSVVFFSKKLGWERKTIHLYEGNGSSTKYALLGPRFEDSFCGHIKVLIDTLKYNDIHNAAVFDASVYKLTDLPGPYDLIYSFYSIGFHWSLEYFLDDIATLMHESTVAIFTIPESFAPFSSLARFPYQTLDWKPIWPKGSRLKLLVISKVEDRDSEFGR